MLDYLRIRGLALLDDVALELAPGMNVLTGETGAGKSIIVDALALLRGARGRAELVREGASGARVEAQFGLDDKAGPRIAELLAERGIELDPSEGLVVERLVNAKGRGRSLVQANLTTQGVLGEVGELLVDICSQHEHHSLTHVARHLDLLDAYAGLEAEGQAQLEAHRAWVDARQALEDLQERAADGEARADYLRFQIDELARVAPEPGEYDELRKRLTLMRDAHRWMAFARQALDALYEGDSAIAGRLSSLLDEARRGPQDSGPLGEMGEQLAAAQIACEEAASAAARLAADIDIEPTELEQSEERLHELEKLRRKHGCEPDELADRLEAMEVELEQLDDLEGSLRDHEARAEKLRAACEKGALTLHEARVAAAEGLARAVEDELAALHMPHARLQARVELRHDEHGALELGPRGADRVEFLFSANPGEPLAPLNRVASGGELSRVLLAVKGVLATGDRVATYVFDEVDAGVGGAVAEAIGRRLQRAAGGNERQVLCITHLPQIAAFADGHYKVEKRTVDGRTVTRVRLLDADERVDEIARMLGGAKVTASAREHATALIEEARAAKAGRGGKAVSARKKKAPAKKRGRKSGGASSGRASK